MYLSYVYLCLYSRRSGSTSVPSRFVRRVAVVVVVVGVTKRTSRLHCLESVKHRKRFVVVSISSVFVVATYGGNPRR